MRFPDRLPVNDERMIEVVFEKKIVLLMIVKEVKRMARDVSPVAMFITTTINGQKKRKPIIQQGVCSRASVAHCEQLLIVVIGLCLHHKAGELDIVTEPERTTMTIKTIGVIENLTGTLRLWIFSRTCLANL